jgi:hypothetical protein
MRCPRQRRRRVTKTAARVAAATENQQLRATAHDRPTKPDEEAGANAGQVDVLSRSPERPRIVAASSIPIKGEAASESVARYLSINIVPAKPASLPRDLRAGGNEPLRSTDTIR